MPIRPATNLQRHSWLRGHSLFALASTLAFMAAPGQTVQPTNVSFSLVTVKDLERWEKLARLHRIPRKAPEPGGITCSSEPSEPDSSAPVITVVRPDLDGTIRSPVDVELKFSAAAEGARIDPETLHVCYVGLFTVDITDRLAGHSTVTETGLEARGAALPSGTHRLKMVLADSARHIAVKDVTIRID